MKIAVEGCCHGELDKIYETIAFIEQNDGVKVDLLLICGDFQSVRNRSDLQAMAVPDKYQKMNTFYKYYSGEAVAPVLTLFIGGNHEASNYLQELPYGGWVAPKIFYMGYANVVNFGGVRIGGVSGIYKVRDYMRGHYEHPPYNNDTKRSAYHVRNLEIFRMKQLKAPVDIMLSHDWPQSVYNHGNTNKLLNMKKFLAEEVQQQTLGSPPLKELLYHMQPDYWFAAHLHVKFSANVQHPQETPDAPAKCTKFLSLDKCLPRKQFLQVLDIPHDASKALKLELDPEWLHILKSTNHLLTVSRANTYLPLQSDFSATEKDLKTLEEDFGGVFNVPENFEQTAPIHTDDEGYKKKKSAAPAPQICINPQTTLLCEMLGLTDPFAVFSGKQSVVNIPGACVSNDQMDDSALAEDESSMGASDDEEGNETPSFIDSTYNASISSVNSTFNSTINPDEILLGSSDEEGEENEGDVDVKDLEGDLKEDSEKSKVDRAEGDVSPSVSNTAISTLLSPIVGPKAKVTSDSSQKSSVLLSQESTEQACLDSDNTSGVFTGDAAPSTEETQSLSARSASSVSSQKQSSIEAFTDNLSSVTVSPDTTAASSVAASSSATDSPAPSMPKKFKRRNQAVYTSPDDQ